MTDVAQLGISVDSSQVSKGAAELDKLSKSAGNAEQQTAKVGKAAAATAGTVKNAGAAAGLAASQWQNLGFQVNDVATSLASGASPFQVMAQQGGQVYQALSSGPGGVAGGLKAVGEYLTGLVTPARVAVGSLTAIGAVALLSYSNWKDAQEKITTSLMGIGRASGATVTDINNIAKASASAAGISVQAATDIATAMASTGQISKDSFGAIIGITKNFAKVMGVDVSEAADVLAKSFADPVKGAEQLNQRLGFLDFGTQTLIKSLVQQNRVFEAQKVLIDGVRDSTIGAADSTGFWTRQWNGIKNAASDAGTAVGKAIDSATGGGALEDQYSKALAKVEQIKSVLSDDQGYADILRKSGVSEDQIRSIVPNLAQMQSALRSAQAEADGLRASMEAVAASSEKAKSNAVSMRLGPAVSALVPEIDTRRSLANINAAVSGAGDDSAMIKSLGLTAADVALAKSRAEEASGSFLTTIQRTIAASDIAAKGVNARSPAQKADIAYQQTMIQLSGQNISLEEKKGIAAATSAVVAAQGYHQLSEASKERIRGVQDGIGAIGVEQLAIGKTTGEAHRLTLEYQLLTEVRREAARNGITVDPKEIDRLKDLAKAAGEARQKLAEANLNNQIGFDRSQIGRTDTEQRVQATLRSSGVDPNSEQGAFLQQQLRINEQLRESKELASDFAKGFVHDLMAGKSATEALSSAFSNLASKLMDKALDGVISGLFSGLTGGAGGGLGSMFGALFKAEGGYITGPGGPKSDSIPAMLSDGEFVVNAAATKRFGPMLEAINRGGTHFADGGMAGFAPGGESGVEFMMAGSPPTLVLQ